MQKQRSGKADNRQNMPLRLTKRIGQTTYKVNVDFSKSSNESWRLLPFTRVSIQTQSCARNSKDSSRRNPTALTANRRLAYPASQGAFAAVIHSFAGLRAPHPRPLTKNRDYLKNGMCRK